MRSGWWLFLWFISIGNLRGIPAGPRPLEYHPGNIFVQGEPVHLEIGRLESNWVLYDYDGQEQERGMASRGLVRLGPLPVGWYELRSETRTNWLGVIDSPPSEVSSKSPVALDLALAWRVAPSNWTAVVNLARLTGASWVRDRLGWGELETAPNGFAKHTRYDDAIRAASQAGLNVLEVNHQSPGWAGTNASRFPEDLRSVHDFYKYVAGRWKGVVKAVEPWNEADIEVFGGHLGSEIASFQKAAWFGLKAGNPDVVVCQNVFAVPQANILADFVANDAVAYYQTFNLHHYVAPSSYPDLYRLFRSVSQGRPLWTTEANWPLHWSEAGSAELSRDDLREQAERVAKVLGSTLVEGASHIFYFVLPHYSEGATQFGLLRPDLSPRPAYVAFAAAGRLLANARPIGSLDLENGGRVLAFRVRFEGRDRDLIIAWGGSIKSSWKLPAGPLAVFDHLGRRLNAPQLVRAADLTLSKAPIFALFATGDLKETKWVPPPANPSAASVAPSPVVLQAVWPGADCVRSRSALRLPGDRRAEIPIYAYNFGDRPASGTLQIPPHSPVVLGLRQNSSTEADLALPLTVQPGQRLRLSLVLDGRHPALDWFNQPVRIEGDFGSQGHAKLSLNIAPDPNVLALRGKQYLLGAEQPSNWQLSSSGNGRVTVASRKDGALQFNASPKSNNRFVFPRYPLLENERPDDSVVGVVVSLTPLSGSGTWSIIVEEANGSMYLAPLKPQPRPGQTTESVAWLEDASWGSTWSVFDDNNKLDTRLIRAIRIGCNTPDKDIKFTVQKIRWLMR